MPTYLGPIGVPQWAEGEKPKREQFNKVFEDLNTAYAGISTDAVQRAETAAASAKQNAQGAAASAEQARQIAANTEVQYQVREDQVGFKRPADKDYTWTGSLTGPQGPTGKPLHVAGHFDTLDALNAAYPTGDGENAYLVGGKVYVFADGAWREIGVDVTATDVPTAAGKTVQQELDSLHTDVWDAFNVLTNAPKNYATSRPCIIRPSFRGRTAQDGTPSPNSPAPIKGVLNPWARAYTGEPVQVTADVEPLMKLRDGTADQRAYKDGFWGVERNTIKIILDGNEFWGGAATSELYYYVPQGLREEARDNLLCDKFAAGTVPAELSAYQICISWQGSIHIRIPESVVPRGNLDALKAWLAANPITVYGPAATPTFEPISAWNGYGKIDPITATTTITKPNTNAPISPDNIATITGTPVVTTGYRGIVRHLAAELFDGDTYDGVNLTQDKHRITFNGTENWGVGGWNDYYCLNFTFENQIECCTHFRAADSHEDITDNTGTAYVNPVNKILSVNYDNGAIGVDAWKAKLAEWAAAGQPLEVVYELATPVITRHDMDLPLVPGDWIIECGDDNGLLESMDIAVLPDPTTYGNRIYPYQHTKVGNVHQLAGTPGAAEISFTATAPYQDGDTWTINGAPVAATYADGQALLPTAVIVGESVRAVLEREAVKHIDGVILPGENLLQNGDFRSAANSIDQWYTAPTATLTPSAGCVILSDTNQNNDPSMTQSLTKLLKSGDALTIAILCERTNDPSYDMTFGIWTGQNWEVVTSGVFRAEKSKQTFVARCVLAHNVGAGAYFAIGCRGAGLKIYAVKLEIGPRFTGWNAPLFDALRLLMDKPTPQPNLIVNGLFDADHLVNQQGQNNYTTGYGIDMWRLDDASGQATVVVNSDGSITITNQSSAKEPCWYTQLRDKQYDGGLYTCAIQVMTCAGDCSLYFGDGRFGVVINHNGVTYMSHTLSIGNIGARIVVFPGASITMQAVKLEEGPRFTGWYEPKPEAELAECQRHFETVNLSGYNTGVVGTVYSGDGAVCYFRVPFKVRKRAVPVLALNTNAGRFVTPTEVMGITSLRIYNASVDGVSIMATLDHLPSTFTSGWVDSIGVLGFSADL